MQTRSHPCDGLWIVQLLPWCARNEPAQLLATDADVPALIAWPDEATTLQAAGTQPDALAVVDEDFEAVGRFVAEDVGTVLHGTAGKALHDAR